MDNLTHALVGVALAECALPAAATRATRRVFMAAGIAAANAPDLDLAYTWITEAPLGYLLHHRGHSHTLPGLVVLGAAVAGACAAWPAARHAVTALRLRFATMLAIALASHLLFDAANVYGTHLLYPFTSRWYYGDAVFIFEPWVWLLLGVSAVRNARGVWPRRVVWTTTVLPPVILLWVGLLTPGVLVALLAAGAGLFAALAPQAPRARAAIALAATVIVFGGFLGLSPAAKAVAADAIRAADGGEVLDIAANPNPAVPWCWSIVSLERAPDGRALVVRRGTVSLLPALRPAVTCVSHHLLPAASSADLPPGTAGVSWNRQWQVDADRLRSLAARDCRVASWLQFGRIPFIGDGTIADLRFDNPIGGNFSAMAIDANGAGGCPTNLTTWTSPRADVLASPTAGLRAPK